MKKTVSVIIPVFNEEKVLHLLFPRLHGLEKKHADYMWEFVFVNDGSCDRSSLILKEQAARRPNYRCLHFSRNFGHQRAVTAGLDHAKGEVVAILDADLQDPPEVLGEMIRYWEKGYSIVYGKRRRRAGESLFKKKSAEIFYRLLSCLTDTEIPVDTGDFRLMDRKVVETLRGMHESSRFIRGLVAWTGFSSYAYEYDRQPRAAGETKYPLKKMIKFATDAILSFSNLPLRIASYLGWVITGLGLVGIVVVVYLKIFTNQTVPGISAVLVSVIFFGGIQLTILGVVGEYVGRIFDEVKGRPLYIIGDSDNLDRVATLAEPQKGISSIG